MALANMQKYNNEIVGTTIELLGQMTNKFNQASGGAIVLSTDGFRGDFDKESFFTQIAGAQRRVNRYGANNAQAATELAQSELVGVKVAGGFGPVLFEPSQLSWLQRDPGAAIMAISEGFADALLADQLNTAVGAAVSAVENVAALVNDVSATGAISQIALNGSHAKFGDSSSMLVTDVMTGSVYHRLIGEALGYGTEGITTNADTHTSTIADGATDPVRAMYVEYTGTLDSACTITIAPNTINRMQFIENGTSVSQNIIIS